MIPELESREGVCPALSVPSYPRVMKVYGDEIVQRHKYYTILTQSLRTLPENEELQNIRETALRRYDWFGAWVVDATLKDLDEIDATFLLSNSDIFILDGLKSEQIAGIAEWAAHRARMPNKAPIPYVATILHFDIPKDDATPVVEQAYRDVFTLIREAGLADRFVFFADTDALAAYFSDLAGMAVTTVPIPHTRHPDVPTSRPDNDAPTVGFAGGGHRGHGFHLLPFVVERFSNLAAAGRLRFEIQANTADARDELISLARLALKWMPAAVHDGALSPRDYYGLIARSDICIFPYLGLQFRTQSSGVFAEVLAYGAVPIVPANTWMAEIAERHGIGVVFAPSTMQGLYAAIDHALSNLDALKRRSAAFAGEWRRINSPENYLDVMGGRIGGDSLLNPAFMAEKE
ncbi:MAG: hypothetical protein M0006_08770 [Magnetospirillum sp.]|nr:hypothetical protein [Magnetospirillum sp.]